MSAITTHVLDTSAGRPGGGILVVLEIAAGDGQPVVDGAPPGTAGLCPMPRELGRGHTDADGRLRTLLAAGAPLERGTYRLTFHTGAWFAANGVTGFYPEVRIDFEVRDPTQHFHVPLLLSPYGYATYRGS